MPHATSAAAEAGANCRGSGKTNQSWQGENKLPELPGCQKSSPGTFRTTGSPLNEWAVGVVALGGKGPTWCMIRPLFVSLLLLLCCFLSFVVKSLFAFSLACLSLAMLLLLLLLLLL